MKNNFGKLIRAHDGFQVKFERVFNHNILTVWDALTHPEKLRVWFTDIEMDFKPGGKITFWFRDEAKTATYGELVSIEKPHRFVFTWEGELAVWELKEEGPATCRLTLTYSKMDDQYAVGASAGFHTLLGRLEAALEGQTQPYPFGTEENDPEQVQLRNEYGEVVYSAFPELKRHEPLLVEKLLHASAERVWQAITDKEQMKIWYFDIPVFRPEVGFEFEFYGTDSECREYLHKCKITALIPLQKLTYSWQYDGMAGISFVTFELVAKGDKTLLRLTHRGLGSFPTDNPAVFGRDSFNEGWTTFITVVLPDYLAKNP